MRPAERSHGTTQIDPSQMRDADFLHHVLSDNLWHAWDEIMRRSAVERGCGLTIHSRAAELRKCGLVIECRSERVNRRSISLYRLVPLDATEDTTEGLTPLPIPSSRASVASSGPPPNLAPSLPQEADGNSAGSRDGCGQLALTVEQTLPLFEVAA